MNIIKTDEQFTVKGYAVEVAEQEGYMSLRTGYGSGDYVVPDNYVCITFHDDDGNECYLLQPGKHREDCDVHLASHDENVDPDDYDCNC